MCVCVLVGGWFRNGLADMVEIRFNYTSNPAVVAEWANSSIQIQVKYDCSVGPRFKSRLGQDKNIIQKISRNCCYLWLIAG